MISQDNSKSEYDAVADKIHNLRDKKQNIQAESAGKDEIKKHITDMSALLKEQPTSSVDYDESLVRR